MLNKLDQYFSITDSIRINNAVHDLLYPAVRNKLVWNKNACHLFNYANYDTWEVFNEWIDKKRNVIYLIKRTVPVEISKAITIPKAIGTNDDDEEVTFLCCIDDNKRDEQWMSIDKIFGGGPIENIGGGGGNWEQCSHV